MRAAVLRAPEPVTAQVIKTSLFMVSGMGRIPFGMRACFTVDNAGKVKQHLP